MTKSIESQPSEQFPSLTLWLGAIVPQWKPVRGVRCHEPSMGTCWPFRQMRAPSYLTLRLLRKYQQVHTGHIMYLPSWW